MKVSVEEAVRLNTTLFSMMSVNTGHKADYFARLLKDKSDIDWFITVEEARRMNIVNRVGVPEFKSRVEVKYILE